MLVRLFSTESKDFFLAADEVKKIPPLSVDFMKVAARHLSINNELTVEEIINLSVANGS